jgi:hypothetical protein
MFRMINFEIFRFYDLPHVAVLYKTHHKGPRGARLGAASHCPAVIE